MKTLTIYTVATEGYHHALEVQARRVCANASALTERHDLQISVVLVTNDPSLVEAAAAVYRQQFGSSSVTVIARPFKSGLENYKVDAQLLIAQMRTEATREALSREADLLWSLDSDVIPPHNALRCMLDMLEFDAGYYQVAFCPYPSQGGGPFLSGRGTLRQPILPDFYEDERQIPEGLLEKRDELSKAIDAAKGEDEGLFKELDSVDKSIRETPPKDNVFACNANGWRRRGWFDCAYPAIGKGSVVPVDWTGFGCTLMSREAAALCDWIGYEGFGTEDLFVNFRRWYAHGIRICSIPHCVCDHVVRARDGSGKLVHVIAYHETEGECVGHLRQRTVPWYAMVPGEKSDPSNDGKLYTPNTAKISPAVAEVPAAVDNA